MIAGIILAAGEGKRIGKDKLKLPLGSKSVIEWVLNTVLSSMIEKIIIVTKPDDINLFEIVEKLNMELITNPDYKQGMSTSIKKALIEVNNYKNIDAFFLILGDQPFITPQIINTLISNFTKRKKEIVVPYYHGKRGNPVLFDIEWKEELMNITGDVGGRVLIKNYPDYVKKVCINDDAILFDIDTDFDYLNAYKYFMKSNDNK